jgi:hypothetical protein
VNLDGDIYGDSDATKNMGISVDRALLYKICDINGMWS